MTDPSQRCPACWSAVAADSGSCSECGAPLGRGGRAGSKALRWFLALAILAGGGWWLRDRLGIGGQEDRTGPDKVETEPRSAALSGPPAGVSRRPQDPGPGSTAAAQAPANPFLAVQGSRGQATLQLLAVRAAGRPGPASHLLLPIQQLPLGSDLFYGEQQLDLQVVHLDQVAGLLLLRAATPLALDGLELAPQAQLEQGLQLHGPGLEAARPVTVTAGGIPLQLDRALRSGRALVDPAGHVQALSLGGSQALGTWSMAPWLEATSGRPLEDVQAELRAKDPSLVLSDARTLLQSQRSAGDMRRALALLDGAQHLLRKPEQAEAFDELLRFGHQQLVRKLSANDGVKALTQARLSLGRFADHHALRADTVELALDHGAASEGLDLMALLRQQAPKYAQAIEDRVCRRLVVLGHNMLAAGDNQAALQLLRQACLVFSRRADLSLQLTRALAATGDRIGAQTQARYTLGLDPSTRSKLRRYLGSPRRSGRSVAIPVPRGSTQIRTSGRAGAEALAFIVDTGASYTTVPRAVAQRLGLLKPDNPKIRVRTASGHVETVQVILPRLSIAGKLQLSRVKALVLDLPGGRGNEALLGLNVLRRLNMRMDSAKSQLILRQGKR